MYKIIQLKKKTFNVDYYDYVFKDFDTFYKVAANLLTPLVGTYKVCITIEDANKILDFIKIEDNYSHLDITIATNVSTLEYISIRSNTANVEGVISDFDVYKELIEKHEVLFSREALRTLYNSIPHDYESMDNALSKIKEEFGESIVTDSMLSKLFVLNKLIYPRQVLQSFLRFDRWRWVKLKNCLTSISNDIVFYSIRKELNKMIDDKAKYIKTSSPAYMRNVNTVNLNFAYRVFCLDNLNIKNVELLFKLYERGVTPYDFLLEKEDEI